MSPPPEQSPPLPLSGSLGASEKVVCVLCVLCVCFVCVVLYVVCVWFMYLCVCVCVCACVCVLGHLESHFPLLSYQVRDEAGTCRGRQRGGGVGAVTYSYIHKKK